MDIYIVIFAAVIAVTVSLQIGHPCRVSTTLITNNGDEFYANTTCLEGKIYWHYPSGTIRVIFERDDPFVDFEVCLGFPRHFNRARDWSTGEELPLKNLTGGETHCVWNTEGRVTLEFESNIRKTYLAIISYEVFEYPFGYYYY